jgi:deoxyribonuclease IV
MRKSGKKNAPQRPAQKTTKGAAPTVTARPAKKATKAAAKKIGKGAAKGVARKVAKPAPKVATRRKEPPLVPAAKAETSASRKRAFDAKSDSAYDPSWVPPVWNDDVLLGAHVSIAGGTQHAPFRARATGASAMQMFTKMANRWAERACDDDECVGFRAALGETRVRETMAHDSYLINLASPDATLRRQSIESFVGELQRCEALSLTYLVSHPGNFLDDRASGVRRNAEAIAEALERVPGRTILCMETTAGSGTAIGATFEELAELIALVPEPHRARMGICVDTCHIYSAGYDLAKDFDGVWSRFDDTLGMARLRVLHLNDSKTPFASRRDRHELIGEGSLGEGPFRRIMSDARFARVPKILETPKLSDATATDARMMARLRGWIAG